MLKSPAAIRIIIDLCLIVAVMQGWWIVVLIIGLIGLVVCNNFIETVLAGLAYDALFHPALAANFSSHVAAVIGACSYGVAAIVRSSFRRRL